jgi:hypothetical protein
MGEIERHDYSEINQLLKALRGSRLSASRGLVVRHFFISFSYFVPNDLQHLFF